MSKSTKYHVLGCVAFTTGLWFLGVSVFSLTFWLIYAPTIFFFICASNTNDTPEKETVETYDTSKFELMPPTINSWSLDSEKKEQEYHYHTCRCGRCERQRRSNLKHGRRSKYGRYADHEYMIHRV